MKNWELHWETEHQPSFVFILLHQEAVRWNKLELDLGLSHSLERHLTAISFDNKLSTPFLVCAVPVENVNAGQFRQKNVRLIQIVRHGRKKLYKRKWLEQKKSFRFEPGRNKQKR